MTTPTMRSMDDAPLEVRSKAKANLLLSRNVESSVTTRQRAGEHAISVSPPSSRKSRWMPHTAIRSAGIIRPCGGLKVVLYEERGERAGKGRKAIAWLSLDHRAGYTLMSSDCISSVFGHSRVLNSCTRVHYGVERFQNSWNALVQRLALSLEDRLSKHVKRSLCNHLGDQGVQSRNKSLDSRSGSSCRLSTAGRGATKCCRTPPWRGALSLVR